MRNNRLLTPLLVLFLCTGGRALFAQPNFSSTLPIMVVQTNGFDVPDEPKIPARLRVIDNGPGMMNELNGAITGYNGWVGIEVRGSSSQSFPKVGYAVETRTEGGEDLEVSLLGFPQEEDWVLNGPYSDKSLLRNALAYTLAGKITPYAPRVRMVELVINGDYKGVYLFTEKIKRDNDRVDVSKMTADSSSGDALTGGYILKVDKSTAEDPEIATFFVSQYRAETELEQAIRFTYHYPRADRITAPQKNYIQNWMNSFEDALAGSDYLDSNDGYRQFVDLPSFVDFLIINEISRNVDGYRLSTYLYKDKDSDGGKLHMGPVWDFNLAFGNANYCGGAAIPGWGFNFGLNCPDDFWQLPFWWSRMQEDPEFQQLLADRWRSLRQNAFSNDALENTVDSLRNILGDAPERNFARWPVIGEPIWPNFFVGDSYEEEINFLKGWVTDRADWMDGAMPGLTPVREAARPEELRAVPNPTTGLVRLEGVLANELEEVSVYDLAGRLLLRQSNTNDVDLKPFPGGMYLLQVRDRAGRLLSTRVVKE